MISKCEEKVNRQKKIKVNKRDTKANDGKQTNNKQKPIERKQTSRQAKQADKRKPIDVRNASGEQ